MILQPTIEHPPAEVGATALHVAARRRMVEHEQGGWFRSDWLNAAFVHLEVDAEALQRITPFEIDRFQGRAYVSLVAFTMRRFRPRFTGSLGAAGTGNSGNPGGLQLSAVVLPVFAAHTGCSNTVLPARYLKARPDWAAG
jgi:hypothetical protein